MKLFQIEEPDGTPLDSDGPGVAVGIEISSAKGAAVAAAVGGNAELLPDRDGVAWVPASEAMRLDGAWDEAALQALLLRLRERAEKSMARPVTHAVIALGAADEAARSALTAASSAAGLVLLRVIDAAAAAGLARGARPDLAAVLGAAIAAEDDAASLQPR